MLAALVTEVTNDCEPVTRLLRTMHPVSKAHCIKSYAGRIFSLFTFAFSLRTFRICRQLPGPVVSILDGDTIEVQHNRQAERIRLNGIDCPEKGQAYGQRAKQAASAFVYGKEVTLQTYGLDKYGRTLADVFLSDGTNVNHALVKEVELVNRSKGRQLVADERFHKSTSLASIY